jgi:hypothetical protein
VGNGALRVLYSCSNRQLDEQRYGAQLSTKCVHYEHLSSVAVSVAFRFAFVCKQMFIQTVVLMIGTNNSTVLGKYCLGRLRMSFGLRTSAVTKCNGVEVEERN